MLTRAERLALIYDEVTVAAGTATDAKRREAAERLLMEVLTEWQKLFPDAVPTKLTDEQQQQLIEQILNGLGVTIPPAKLAIAKDRLKTLYLWVHREWPRAVTEDEY